MPTLYGARPKYVVVDESGGVDGFWKREVIQEVVKRMNGDAGAKLFHNLATAHESKGWLDAVRYGELSMQALEEERVSEEEDRRNALVLREEQRKAREVQDETEHLRTLPTFGMF